MSPEGITGLILEYRYLILIPLSFVEGPIVAFLAGTLASLGYFNIYALGVFFFARDMTVDLVGYSVGYFGGKSALSLRMLRKIGVSEEHLEAVRRLWVHHPARTMFLGKLAYGLAASFVILAGTVRMPLSKFLGWGALVSVLQFGSLLLLGYFFGATFSSDTAHLIQNVLNIVAGVVVLGSLYYMFAFFFRKRIERATEKRTELHPPHTT